MGVAASCVCNLLEVVAVARTSRRLMTDYDHSIHSNDQHQEHP